MKNLKFKILRPPLVPTLCVGMPYFDALRRIDAKRQGNACPRKAWARG